MGYVYIAFNKFYKTHNEIMVKIGYTGRDTHKRAKELSSYTSTPGKFEVYAYYETSKKDADKPLHALIEKLDPSLKVNKEFYRMSPEKAYDILKFIAKISDSENKLTLLMDYNKKRNNNCKLGNNKPKKYDKLEIYNLALEAKQLFKIENPTGRLVEYASTFIPVSARTLETIYSNQWLINSSNYEKVKAAGSYSKYKKIVNNNQEFLELSNSNKF